MTMILNKIEQKAEEVLKVAGLSTLPIPVEDVAGSFQIRIRRAPHSDFSGMLLRKDGKALIGVSSTEAPVRQRFTIAHELGHYFLHPNTDAFVDYRDNKKGVMRTPREKEANMFAAALLMPQRILLRDFSKIAKSGFADEELGILARRYDVSEDAMRFRLLNLKALGLTARAPR